MTSRCSDRLLDSRPHSQLLLWTGTGELPIPPALQTRIHLELAIKGRSDRIGYDVQLANSNMDHCASTLIDCTFFFSRWTRWACSCCVTSISMEHDLSRPIPGQIAGDRSPHAGALALATVATPPMLAWAREIAARSQPPRLGAPPSTERCPPRPPLSFLSLGAQASGSLWSTACLRRPPASHLSFSASIQRIDALNRCTSLAPSTRCERTSSSHSHLTLELP